MANHIATKMYKRSLGFPNDNCTPYGSKKSNCNLTGIMAFGVSNYVNNARRSDMQNMKDVKYFVLLKKYEEGGSHRTLAQTN